MGKLCFHCFYKKFLGCIFAPQWEEGVVTAHMCCGPVFGAPCLCSWEAKGPFIHACVHPWACASALHKPVHVFIPTRRFSQRFLMFLLLWHWISSRVKDLTKLRGQKQT